MNVTEAAQALAATQARIAELEETAATLKAVILANTAPGDTIEVGGQPIFRVVPGRRTFKPAKAAKLLSPEVAAAATVAKIDGAALKRLSPALWEQCCDQGAPFVTAAT